MTHGKDRDAELVDGDTMENPTRRVARQPGEARASASQSLSS